MLTEDSVEFAEIVQGLGNFRVIRTKDALPDFKGSCVELQGFFVAAFLDIDTCEIVQGCCKAHVFDLSEFFHNFQRPGVEDHGFLISCGLEIEQSKVV